MFKDLEYRVYNHDFSIFHISNIRLDMLRVRCIEYNQNALYKLPK
jgi:hypothetical protein